MRERGEDCEDGEDVWRRRKCGYRGVGNKNREERIDGKSRAPAQLNSARVSNPKGTYAKAAGDVHRTSHVEKFPFPPTGTAESPESIRFFSHVGHRRQWLCGSL